MKYGESAQSERPAANAASKFSGGWLGEPGLERKGKTAQTNTNIPPSNTGFFFWPELGPSVHEVDPLKTFSSDFVDIWKYDSFICVLPAMLKPR